MSRICPGEIGMISRKARTRGVERIKWHCGSTRSGSGESGTFVVVSFGYALLMRQKAQGIGYISSMVGIVAVVRHEGEDVLRWIDGRLKVRSEPRQMNRG